jgi:NADH dehydrogenase
MTLADKPADRKRVLIVGAGFGGLTCAHHLSRSGLDVVLIDRHDYSLFQPLLYQVALGQLAPDEITSPIRELVRDWPDVRFELAEAQGLDPRAGVLQTSVGPVAFDYLVVAAGAVPNYFGNETVHKAAFTLTTLPMAEALRNHVLTMLEQASTEADPARRKELLTFTVVGGGPIGVEFSGALAGMVKHVLPRDFPGIARDEVRVSLIQRAPALLPPFPAPARDATAEALRELGVEVQFQSEVTTADEHHVVMQDGAQVPSATLLWATGVKAPALTARLGLPLGHGGRLVVGPDFSVAGFPNIFAIGDIAAYSEDGVPLPGLAQPAMQGGEHVAKVILKQRLGGEAVTPFRYLDKGIMAVIGRGAAVAGLPKPGHFHDVRTPADEKYVTLTGFPAWVAWLGLHIFYLRGFENRLRSLVSWGWDYIALRPADLVASTETREEAHQAVE